MSAADDRAGLRVVDLRVAFDDRPVVRGVSFAVRPGQCTALVGESGCGKTSIALALLELLAPGARASAGSITLDGRALDDPEARRRARGRGLALVPQEPMSALTPVRTVGDQLVETLRTHHGLRWRAARARAVELLAEAGVPEPASRMGAHPHQLSGGLCQRVLVALALACEPRVLLADEPTTALDVRVQAALLARLRALMRERDMGVVLVTHDLGVVAELADLVCVLDAGRLVEAAPAAALFDAPWHPVTRGLLAARPVLPGRAAPTRAAPEAPAPARPAGADDPAAALRRVAPDRWLRTADDEGRETIPAIAHRRGGATIGTG